MDVSGLGKIWDRDHDLRERCRLQRCMCLHPSSQKWCEPTRANCITNAMALKPCLRRLYHTKDYKLPYLEPLQAEVCVFFGRLRLPLEEKMGYRTSVELKKMCGFVKRKALRKEFGKDYCLQNTNALLSHSPKKIVLARPSQVMIQAKLQVSIHSCTDCIV